MATVNEIIFDQYVRHQIGLTRLASGTAAALVKRLNAYDPRIVAILNRIDGRTSLRQANRILSELRKINRLAFNAVEKDLTRAMKDLAVSETGFQHKALMNALPADARKQVKPKLPTKKAITEAVEGQPINGALISEYSAGMELGRYNRIRDVVRREIMAGGGDAVSIGIGRAIIGSVEADFRDGVLDVSRRSIDQTVRTVQNGIASMSRDLFTNENDDIFGGVMWVSVLDARTSAICQSLDGTVFPLDEGPRPPAHINCRSTITPVVNDWEALGLSDLGPGTRESMDGEVPETLTYNEWLRGQPAKVQDDILGPNRGALFRKHDIAVDRFVDETGRKWTLTELEEQGLE